MAWTGFWLVEMNPACSCWGHTVEPAVFHMYGLSTILTSLMIYFSPLKYMSWLPQGHCQDPSGRFYKLLLNSEPGEFPELFSLRVLRFSVCLRAEPVPALRQPCR